MGGCAAKKADDGIINLRFVTYDNGSVPLDAKEVVAAANKVSAEKIGVTIDLEFQSKEKINLIMNHAEEDFGQNGIENGPDFYYPQGSKSLMSESLYNVSHLMGTLQSDGKTDHYLRIQNTLIYSYTTLIDYFEFKENKKN